MSDERLDILILDFAQAVRVHDRVHDRHNADALREARTALVSFFSDATSTIECAQARLTAAVDVLDAITTPDGELRLPATDEQMTRLRIAFEAAKAVP